MTSGIKGVNKKNLNYRSYLAIRDSVIYTRLKFFTLQKKDEIEDRPK